MAMRHPLPWLVGIVWSGALALVQAAPVVIHDAGGTEPITPYLAPLLPDPESPSGETPPSAHPPMGVFDLQQRLPITSPGLSPGRLTRGPDPAVAERLRHLPLPFCLVGADPMSLQWLRAHRDALRAAGAVCLAVDVPDVQALTRIQQAGAGLAITAAPGSDLAEALGLAVYPVLVTRDGFEQ